MGSIEKFEGQKMIVLPHKSRVQCASNPFTKSLYLTDIGYYPKAHKHFRNRDEGSSENILILCTSGTGWIELNSKRYHLSKNKYFIIPKNLPHKYGADSHSPWTIYWIHFKGEHTHQFTPLFASIQTIDESKISRLEERLQLFEELLVVLEGDFSDRNLEYSSILLTHLLGSLMYLAQFRKIREAQQKDGISKTLQYMKSNMHQKLSLLQLAEMSGLSISHFSLKFKAQTKQSPIDYLTMMRIQKACNLLSFTDAKIKHIAAEVGYDDPYYFSRLFTKTIGKSPNKYRKDERGL